MADIAIMRLDLIWGVEVRVQHFDHIVGVRADAQGRRSDAFAYEPVASEKGGGAAVEGVAVHRGGFDWIDAKEGETPAEDAGVVVLAVVGGEGGGYGEVIGLGPAFLEADYVREGGEVGEFLADLLEAGAAMRGDVL